jgi:hypothetical protein
MIQSLTIGSSFQASPELSRSRLIRRRLVGGDFLDDAVLHMSDEQAASAAVMRATDRNFLNLTHSRTPSYSCAIVFSQDRHFDTL